MIQLCKSEVIADISDVERCKAVFRDRHCVLLPNLLEPALLEFLLERLEPGNWQAKSHDGIGAEVVLRDPPALALLHFVANSPAFLNVVEEITTCRPLTRFEGRVYRFVPNSGHYDSWHNDHGEGRLVAMSLNLSPHGYEGGIFQLREWPSKRMLLQIANTGWGDATLFRISGQLEHQVTHVLGEQPKTAFAGWFKAASPNPFARISETDDFAVRIPTEVGTPSDKHSQKP